MKQSGVIYISSPIITARQCRVLEWFCKEVSKTMFLEVAGLTFIPQVLGLDYQPPIWLLAAGLVFSLTFILGAVMLAVQGEK